MRVGLVLFGCVFGVAALAQQGRLKPIAYDAARDAYYVADELVVGLEPYASAALASEVMRWVSWSREIIPSLRASVLRLHRGIDPESARAMLSQLAGVRYVERNYLVFACTSPDDPLFSQQWGLERVQAAQAWALAVPQRTVYLAIIDTGVDSSHPDLSQRMRRYSDGTVYGYDVHVGGVNASDFHGHGTHCAGIAAAHTNNGVGVAGVAGSAPVQIMPVKVLSDQGIGTMSDVARGIVWAVDNGAHVLNLSLGGNWGTQQLADAITYAWGRGCLVVAAAGNNGSNAPFYPAYYEHALAVAATDSTDRLTDFSQYGAWVDIAAPGSDILSTVPNSGYARWRGTSMACPHVAGAAAFLWACVPSLTNQQLRIALENHADPVQPFWSEGIGAGKGRLNMARALQAALQMGGVPAVSQLSLNPSSVTAGETAQGVVVLSRAAGAGGTVVELHSSNPLIAWCPARITIPQGQTTGTFEIGTAVHGAGAVTITATSGGVSRTATLQILSSLRVQAVSVTPAAVTGGHAATLTVHLSAPAPAGGVQVALSSSAAQHAVLPPSVQVPEGQSVVQVRVNTVAVAQRVRVTLRAVLGDSQATAELVLSPPAPVLLILAPAVVLGGQSATATVFLNAGAPAHGLWLRVRSSDPSRAWAPQSIYVPAGRRTARFTINSARGRGRVGVHITVATDGGARAATLTVR
jgi:thermitase